jgi:hypothetical protein
MQFPRMTEIEQRLYARSIADIPAAVGRACAEAKLAGRIRPGQHIGITVGSRGIANIAEITRAVATAVKQMGGRPFILPAMGSHGGATAAGQTAVLASLGVTPRFVGAPIRASMAVTRLGKTSGGVEVFVSAEALRADGVIVMNRIKQHTDFAGEYESGLVKMLAIGLGKRAGAAAMHGRRCASLRQDLPEAARMILRRAPIIAGLALLENGYNQPAQIVGLAPEDIPAREPALLRRVRRNAARLPFPGLDLLVVDWIGKDVSGIGLDSHVICRRMIWEEPEEFRGTRIQLIAALDLTEGSHGNALGVGLADLITERLLRKIDMEDLKTNVLHTGWLNRAKIPLSFRNDREVMGAALVALGRPGSRQVRIARIQDTLHLGRLWISEGLLPEARRHPKITVLGKPVAMQFDRLGNFK